MRSQNLLLSQTTVPSVNMHDHMDGHIISPGTCAYPLIRVLRTQRASDIRHSEGLESS